MDSVNINLDGLRSYKKYTLDLEVCVKENNIFEASGIIIIIIK
jgi:hypothetical protein